jgi:3,4-dihydroxy-2-butanone 4-phosphate synthase
MEFKFDPIEEIVEEIRQGHIVIMQDPADRENEGDYICAAELYAYGGGNCRCAVSCSDGSS